MRGIPRTAAPMGALAMRSATTASMSTKASSSHFSRKRKQRLARTALFRAATAPRGQVVRLRRSRSRPFRGSKSLGGSQGLEVVGAELEDRRGLDPDVAEVLFEVWQAPRSPSTPRG